jgi:arylsulfatase A-like enzyme/uncharacterized protein YjdB
MMKLINRGVAMLGYLYLTFLANAQEKPNIVFVFADEYRGQAVGYAHEDPVYTPNLDALAKGGVAFSNGISSCPVCTPYRGMLITGKYPLRNGMTRNCSDVTDGLYLRPDASAFGNAFKNNGYQTGYIGKWHLDDAQYAQEILGYSPDGTRGWDTYTPPGPKRQGFDFWHAYNAYDQHMHPHYWENTTEMIEPDIWSPQHEADVAINYIENRDKSKPFLIMISMNPPHPPFGEVPDQYHDAYDETDIFFTRKNVSFTGDAINAETQIPDYFAAVTGIDEQMGRLVNYLKQNNIFDNTIIVFTADHGEMMASQGRMFKSKWYEEAINVPLLISYPDKLSPGVSECLVSPIDYLPTLLGLSGLEVPEVYDGKDLSNSVINVEVSQQDTVFLASYPGDYDSSPDSSWMELGWRGIRTRDKTFVIVRNAEGQSCYLYDMVNDKYQMNPITASVPEDKIEFAPYLASLAKLLEKMGDPFLEKKEIIEAPYSLMQNPGFEDGTLTGWNNWANGITSDAENVYAGNYAGMILAGKSGSLQQTFSLMPNTSYHFSVWAKMQNEGETAVVIIKDYDDIGTKKTIQVDNTSYTQYTYDFTTGSNPEFVLISVYKANAAFGEVYADNYELYEVGDLVKEIRIKAEDQCGMVTMGEPYQMEALVYPITALDKSLVWSISPVTGQATVDQNGLVSGVLEGTILVEAVSNDGTNVMASYPLTVVNELPLVTSIGIISNLTSNEVVLGSSIQLSAVLEPDYLCDTTVLWSFEKLSGDATITLDGLFRATAEGQVKIIATSMADPTVFDELILTLVPGERQTYYVDATLGDDSNDGLSINSAWKTLSKVNAGIYSPGDSILFKSGETWSGQLEIETDGLKGIPVVFTSYGEGVKPRIDGNGEKDYTIRLLNSNYTEAKGFEVTNKGIVLEGGRYGVMLNANNEGPIYSTVVRNMDVHDVNGDPVKANGGGGGIVWKIEGETPSRLIDALIEGCHVYDCERNGIVGKSAYNSAAYQKMRDYYSLRLIVRQNLIERIPGDAIVMLGCDSSIAEYNVCRDFTDVLPQGDAAAGIWPWNSLNTTIQHNEVSDHMAGWDGQGFDSDWNCENTIIQYNYSHDNAGGFILICSKGSVGYNDNTIVRYNLSINDGFRTWGNGAGFCPSIHLAGNIFNTKIYNNTIYAGPKPTSVEKSFIEATNWEAWSNVTYIYNNIFFASDASEFIMGGSTNNSFNHNLYSANAILPADHNPLRVDPQFIQPGESDNPENYKLKSGSLAIGKGILIFDNGGLDFFGNSVGDTALPSIGAYNGTGLSASPEIPARSLNPLFTLYPNPTSEPVISLEVKEPCEKVSISLFTLNGKLVETRYFEHLTGKKEVFDLTNKRAGMYIIVIKNPEYKESHKFIKL